MGLLTSSVLGLASCDVERAQLLVGVDTDLSWGPTGMIQSVVLEIRRGDQDGVLRSRRMTAVGPDDGLQALPLWVTVVSLDESDGSPLWVQALGCARPTGCTRETAVVAQRASVRFAKGWTGELRLLLADACVSRTCAPSERCHVLTGQCVGVDAQTEVRPYTGELPGSWAGIGVARDAGLVDVVGDGAIDAVSDVGCPPSGVPCGDLSCVDLTSSASNCGACGIICPTDQVCIAGRCRCSPPQSLCDGLCVNTNSDGMNCGACGNRCSTGYLCGAGSCQCEGVRCPATDGGTRDAGVDAAVWCAVGSHLCSGRCVPDTAVSSCGASCTACPVPTGGSATCGGGACGQRCPSGATLCSGACVLLASDASNCGACGNACPSGQSCSAGVCGMGCPVGTSLCGGICVAALGGACTSIGSGGCAQSGMMVCTAGSAACSASPRTSGACTSPVSGVCTASGACVCGSGTHLCGTRCVSDSAVTSCGALCLACPAPTGGSATCAGGACGQSCPSGGTVCSGACVALATDASHCGSCTTVCASGQSCAGGSCAVRCGDGVVGAGEQCDDRNAVSGDGCSATCQTEVATGSCPTGMRLIPAGMFLMGDAVYAPIHGVQLTAFCMDEAEVTVSAYATCATCSAPDTTTNCNWGVAGRESHPVNCVDWAQARAYCQSRGGDLPTEAQWEYAARGTDGRIYPWGNDAPTSQLCWRGDVRTRSGTCPVRTYPLGNSPFGLFDMAGNVWEWTSDYYAPYTGSASSYVMNPPGPVSGTSRVFRGASWDQVSAINVHASYRNYNSPTVRNYVLGFRCARGAI
ncbi:MAG: SUMF1/EgtB/PvdO family nonheme iron enzyme [Deltaproteobacteria bacterium]|nr:SUMF1/EgtB/PvdO family nonheme iron enzyme [Deltaproteobacteria bacterium]MBP6830478.1 SUMF1/EgtB/PvdO family nonheme iron enzyme [Deltaproteobacteria bacterium]